MPRGVPVIGQGTHLPDPDTPSEAVLGTITDARVTEPGPTPVSSTWQSGDVTVELTEPPPPWELPGGDYALSDARRFVQVPDNWELRWINPKLLDQFGWRYWQPVMKSDPRVKVKVQTMVSPEGNIRRGGYVGDILAWMYRSWVEARRAEQQRETARLTESAVDRQRELRQAFARGSYGPNLRLEETRHPRDTSVDGREMRQRGD